MTTNKIADVVTVYEVRRGIDLKGLAEVKARRLAYVDVHLLVVDLDPPEVGDTFTILLERVDP